MPTPFLWNQSHTGLVDVNENSLSLWRIHALQEIAPAPQPLRLIKLQTDAKKTNLFEKTAAVFLGPVYDVRSTRGLKTEADYWTRFT